MARQKKYPSLFNNNILKELVINKEIEQESGDKTIRNLQSNQKQILKDIIQMHNNGNSFECDITASELKFYGDYGGIYIEEPKYLFDVYPQSEKITKIEPDGNIPLPDNSVSSIVCDLPFVVSTVPFEDDIDDKNSCMIFKRFHGYYPVYNLYWSYAHWLKECYRVLKDDGILVWKCQNVISGGKFYCTEEFSWMEAERNGFYTLDRFILAAKARLISGKIKKQQHARNFTSSFWVFKKGGKIKTIDYYGLIDRAQEEINNGADPQIGRSRKRQPKEN